LLLPLVSEFTGGLTMDDRRRPQWRRHLVQGTESKAVRFVLSRGNE
jgi:hypothetical protein